MTIKWRALQGIALGCMLCSMGTALASVLTEFSELFWMALMAFLFFYFLEMLFKHAYLNSRRQYWRRNRPDFPVRQRDSSW